MGLNRDINSLVPEAREKAQRMLYECNKAGIRVMINECRRSKEVQAAYYAQGREGFDAINRKRKAAGLWAIGPLEANKIITWTLQSKHIDGKAIDIIPLAPDGKAWWDAPPKVWEGIGIIGENCGFIWGGRWTKTPDKPHFEIE